MRPRTCGRCGGDLATAPGQSERWDTQSRVWTGFLSCPACTQLFVYIRPGVPPRSVSPQLSLPLEAEP
jgi:hypothetical protein